MSRDILGDALGALRDEATGEAEQAQAQATRMRILGTVRAARRRKVVVARTAVLLLAAAIGSTAWAAATGRLPSWPAIAHVLGALDDPGGPPGPGDGPRSAAPATSGSIGAGSRDAASEAGPGPATPADNTPPVADAPSSNGTSPGEEAPAPNKAPSSNSTSPANKAPAANEAPSSNGASSAEKAPVANKAPPANSTSPANKAPPADEPAAPAKDTGDADALYQKAHALHFQAHDASAARAAWEAYLRAAPTGRYATLAHYNHALCLVRLGRHEEAKRALRPFASGAAGGYRRAEAASLLEALEGKMTTTAIASIALNTSAGGGHSPA